MTGTLDRKFRIGIAVTILFCVFFTGKHAYANVLLPGNINTCGELASAGTYTLTTSVSSTSPCYIISSNNVILNGAGFTITGSITGNGTTAGSPGFNFTIENATVTGTTSANGANYGSGGFGGSNAGAGGTIKIASSTLAAIQSNGGNENNFGGSLFAGTGGTIDASSSSFTSISSNGGAGPNSGNGGAIAITGTALNLSSTTISAAGNNGSTDGTLVLYYTTLNHNNLTLSSLSDLILDGPGNSPGNLGAFGGGQIAALPGDTITSASQCVLGFAGTYNLGASFTGNCTIGENGVILAGSSTQQYTITGNVIGDGQSDDDPGSNFTLQNVTVTGVISSNGATSTDEIPGPNAGSIIITGTNVDLASTTISALGGEGAFGSNGSNGTSTIDYTTLNHNNLTLSALSDLVLNGPGNFPGDVGPFNGGVLGTLPGDTITSISQCNLNLAGTYTLGNSLTGNCTIAQNGVILNGSSTQHYSINGNVSGDNANGTGYDFTLQNITVSGTVSSNAASTTAGDSGGSITISTSTVATTTVNSVNGGGGTIIANHSTATVLQANGISGNGGTIELTDNALNLSNMTISASSTGGSVGSLDLNYSTLNYSNLTLSPIKVSNNAINSGSFVGGTLGTNGGIISNISQCQDLPFPGTFTLASSLTGDCDITTSGVILNGAGYTLNGNVVGAGLGVNVEGSNSGNNFTLEDITVTGVTSSDGVGSSNIADGGIGGSITVLNSSLATTTANGGEAFQYNNAGNAGSISMTNSSATFIQATGGLRNNDLDTSLLAGNGGTISLSSTTADSAQADGGISEGAPSGDYGGAGGTINATSSTVTSFEADGADDDNFGAGHTGGAGGFIDIAYSTTTSLSAAGAAGGAQGGNGGTLEVTANTLDLTGVSISVPGGGGGGNSGNPGNLILNYNTLVRTGITLPTLSDLVLNGPGDVPGDTGSFLGGSLNVLPGDTIGNITQCILTVGGTYKLGADLTGDCMIEANGVTLDGSSTQRYTIDGNVVGDGLSTGASGYSFTLENITVTGTTSADGLDGINSGGAGGSITISSSTVATTIANGGGVIQESAQPTAAGAGGTVTIDNSTAALVETDGGLGSDDGSEGAVGGAGGTINVATSTTGALVSDGGDTFIKTAGAGGTINVTNSFATPASSTVTADGGDSTSCGFGGPGGTVNLLDSTYGTVSANPGITQSEGCSNGASLNYYSSSFGGSSDVSGLIQTVGQYISSAVSGSGNVQTSVQTPISPGLNNSVSSAAGGFGGTTIAPLAPASPVSPPPPASAASSFLSTPLGSAAVVVAEQIANTANIVANSPASKTVQATGFFAGLITSVISVADTAYAAPLVAEEALLMPLRLWGIALVGFGIRKRARPWGTVYDSVTKQPIDPAFVTVKNMKGEVVAQSITDIDGRYGFLLPDGTYTVSVDKTNYEFPSRKMEGKSFDELYSNLYFGGPVTVSAGELLDKNIPMDQKDFDWNEAAKKGLNAFSFYSRNEKRWTLVSDWVYGIGFVVSLIVVLAHRTWFNILMLALYASVIVFLDFGVRGKRLGHVTDSATQAPLSFAILRVTAFDHQTLLRSAVCDARGRYYCIVPKGEYYVDIERKNPDGSYSKAYGSDLISSNSGFLNASFTV